MKRVASLLSLGLLLGAGACSKEHDPTLPLTGRWNGTENQLDAYDDTGRLVYSTPTIFLPDDHYIVLTDNTFEDHHLDGTAPVMIRYVYEHRGDTLYLHNTDNILTPHPKLAILEHTPTRLRLRQHFTIGTGRYVNEFIYTR